MPACPTVKIKTAAGPVIINESDFDPAVHERHIDPPPAPVLPPLPPLPMPPVHPLDNLAADWREQDYGTLRGIAIAVSDGRTPENRKQAAQMIDAALKARG